jgi:DNA-binding PucR family transcriptional regulator
MRTYITPLVEHRDAATLLETLEKLYEVARSVEKAARLLGVDRRTVQRRLEKVGELIGRAPRTCHVELEEALRLARLYESAGERADSLRP